MNTKSFLSNLVSTAGTVVIATAAIIITARFAGPLPLSLTQTIAEKRSTFDVTGDSEIESIPDQATITLGISVRRSTVAAAQDEANQVINNIIKELKGLDIDKEDIKTQNYSIRPEYDFRSSERRVTGYSVNASLRVKISDFDKLNQAIDLATARGANQVGGISFSLSTEKEKEVLKESRKEAIADAKEKAQELAKLAGMKLGKIVDVRETPAPGIFPVAFDRAVTSLEAVGEVETTQIEPGSQTLKYSVTLSYETL